MEPCIALKTAIRSRLIAAPALIDLVPANAIFDRHTRPELDRMIVVGTGNTLYADEYDTFADQAFLDLHIWCRDESFTTCQNVAHLIRETLRHAPWRAGEYVVHGISVTSRFLNDPDAAFRHGVVSVTATMKVQ